MFVYARIIKSYIFFLAFPVSATVLILFFFLLSSPRFEYPNNAQSMPNDSLWHTLPESHWTNHATDKVLNNMCSYLLSEADLRTHIHSHIHNDIDNHCLKVYIAKRDSPNIQLATFIYSFQNSRKFYDIDLSSLSDGWLITGRVSWWYLFIHSSLANNGVTKWFSFWQLCHRNTPNMLFDETALMGG